MADDLEQQTGQEPDTLTDESSDLETPTTTEESTRDKGQEPEQPEDDFDKARALETIRKLRTFEKQAREQAKILAEYQRKEQEAEQAKLSEQERLQQQLSQAKAELELERQQTRDRMNAYEVQLQANRLGIVDPDAAVKLLDWSSLDYDEDGRPADIEAALTQLLADKPYLAKTQTPAPKPAATTNAATRTPSPATRIFTAAEIADRDFYVKHRAEIQQAYREGRIRG